jgi:ethanolamine utilization protein EutA (predicted chaperonin)
MTARFLADEHFPVGVARLLRAKGHDVVNVRAHSLRKSGDGWTDEDVVYEAIRDKRVILTDNVPDFRAIAKDIHWHEGMVFCAVEVDDKAKADRIDSLVRDRLRERGDGRLTGDIINARPHQVLITGDQ